MNELFLLCMDRGVMWLDGLCNDCGCLVFECGSDSEKEDYMNICSNPKCINHSWHHIGDMDEPEYYVHRNIRQLIEYKIICDRTNNQGE